MRPVTVQFLKNPDLTHWGFAAGFLGEDDFGIWIGAPAGTERWKGSEHARPTGEDAVFCAPHEGWWHLHYNGDTGKYSHFVDIVTPPVWVDANRYEMIDLDLDVVVHRDGTVEVEDEDEFELHRIKYAYSPEMVAGAKEETQRVVAALQARHEPFFDTAESWLRRLRQLGD